jgi:hypothetical protein
VIDQISPSNPGIPFLDEGGIHFCCIGERTAAKMNNIGVVEMCVGREKDALHSVILLRERLAISTSTPLSLKSGTQPKFGDMSEAIAMTL